MVSEDLVAHLGNAETRFFFLNWKIGAAVASRLLDYFGLFNWFLGYETRNKVNTTAFVMSLKYTFKSKSVS